MGAVHLPFAAFLHPSIRWLGSCTVASWAGRLTGWRRNLDLRGYHQDRGWAYKPPRTDPSSEARPLPTSATLQGLRPEDGAQKPEPPSEGAPSLWHGWPRKLQEQGQRGHTIPFLLDRLLLECSGFQEAVSLSGPQLTSGQVFLWLLANQHRAILFPGIATASRLNRKPAASRALSPVPHTWDRTSEVTENQDGREATTRQADTCPTPPAPGTHRTGKQSASSAGPGCRPRRAG